MSRSRLLAVHLPQPKSQRTPESAKTRRTRKRRCSTETPETKRVPAPFWLFSATTVFIRRFTALVGAITGLGTASLHLLNLLGW